MSKSQRIILYSLLSLAAIYILFCPTFSLELAVRRHLLFLILFMYFQLFIRDQCMVIIQFQQLNQVELAPDNKQSLCIKRLHIANE